LEKIDTIISQVLEIRPGDLKDEISMDNYGTWDSLRNMDLIVELENTFSFQFTFDEISEMTSVGKVREIVGKKLN
jgi:acyl carrier protein